MKSTIGRRFLHTVLWERAESTPDELFIRYYPSSKDLDAGRWEDVSYSKFQQGVQVMMGVLNSLHEKTGEDTFCYIATLDFRYFLTMLAAEKLGYKVSLGIRFNI
jgi:hypothetical protein